MRQLRHIRRSAAVAALALALLAPAAALAQEAPAEEKQGWSVEGNVDLVSDYVFRGISQSNRDPALQAGVTVSHSIGFYAGIWGSNVDFDTPGDGISTEIDYSLGWAGALGGGMGYDLSVVRYTYPGANSGYDISYNEFLGKLTFADEKFFLLLGHANDYARSGEAATYVQAGTDWPLGESGWTLSASAGHYDLSKVYGKSYQDYLLGLGRSFGPVDVKLSYVTTSGASEDIAPRKWTRGRLVAQFSIPFKF